MSKTPATDWDAEIVTTTPDWPIIRITQPVLEDTDPEKVQYNIDCLSDNVTWRRTVYSTETLTDVPIVMPGKYRIERCYYGHGFDIKVIEPNKPSKEAPDEPTPSRNKKTTKKKTATKKD